MSNSHSVLLQRALAADAIVSAATAALMIAGAGWLAEFLSLPADLLRLAGLLLLPYIACVAYTLKRPSRAGVFAIIGINVAWAAACVLLLASGWVAPNAFGVAFVIVQAVAVLLFAELQYIGLKRPVAAA
jgi:hypothetical protein